MRNYLIQFILVILFVNDANADTWENPKVKDYYSSNGKYYIRIYPIKIPEKYYRWVQASARRKKKFQPSDTLLIPCFARLYKVRMGGDSIIWEQQLINDVAPMTAIVSNDGKFVVTFDNWASLGFGIDVMAYYNEKGGLIKRYKLEDISPFPINTYERSISSIWWSGGRGFIDNEQIYLFFRNQNNVVSRKTYNLKSHKMQEYVSVLGE